ncbi:MAG: helix-turn-helix domain-containing protein [Candidatus Dormibacteria bacterium]
MKESELLTAGIERLQAVLPPSWTVQLVQTGDSLVAGGGDALVRIQSEGSGMTAQVLVEAKTQLTPRGVDGLTQGPWEVLRRQYRTPMLVVAPELSARTRERLRAAGIHYLELDGEVSLTLETPGLHVELGGGPRKRAGRPGPGPTLRGPRGGRILRLLVDTAPPYGVGDLALAAGLSQGYTSRLLEALDAEALIERGRRGMVEGVDWAGLLRRWAETYALLRTHEVTGAIGRHGVEAVLDRLRGEAGRWAITGSWAASRLAPVAAPALLAVYTDRSQALLERLELMPVPEGHDVLLLQPADDFVYARSEPADGLFYAAPSQVALDCLTGPGRMPAEGEAVLGWMAEHLDTWRAATLKGQLQAAATG